MAYWVIDGGEYKGEIVFENDTLTLKNGLVERIIDVKNSSTVSYKNLAAHIEYISEKCCDVSFTTEKNEYTLDKGFAFTGIKHVDMIKTVEYFPNKSMSEIRPYPPNGNAVELEYLNETAGLKVRVHYEIYDGIPTIMKQVFIDNLSDNEIVIDNIKTDIMAVCENRDKLFIDSNFNACTDFLGLNFKKYAKFYARYTHQYLEIEPIHKMNYKVAAKSAIDSIIAFETAFTAEYYEQKTIEVKTVYRTIAPWVLDDALFFHLISNSPSQIKKAVDQCAEVGIEMIIQSFGSGVNMESKNGRYLSKIKKAYDYGHGKGLRMGAYTLAYVKNYRPVKSHEALNHDGSHICRCLATDWAKNYTKNILNFIDATGVDAIEIDGPYGMLLCSGGKTHLHNDFTDSQYHQWKLSVDDWYKEIRKRNVYINAPDWHYLNGINRSGVGYEEIAFSEKRAEQLVTSRIYYYKGTFVKTPSMSWGFLPLNVYHGGGKEAEFCPTNINSFEYDWALAQITASGVWPTLRGKKVYDSPKGKEILAKWVSVFKKYRQVLNGNTIHFMPPRIDKKDPTKTICLDAILNEIPYGDTRGFLMLFNQTKKDIRQNIDVPVYYTGLTDLDSPPPPLPYTKSCDVQYPVYGDETAPLVIAARDGKSRTYITDEKFDDAPISDMPPAVLTKNKIIVEDSEGNSREYQIDTNGNISIDVSLKSMTYKYFTMRRVY